MESAHNHGASRSSFVFQPFLLWFCLLSCGILEDSSGEFLKGKLQNFMKTLCVSLKSSKAKILG